MLTINYLKINILKNNKSIKLCINIGNLEHKI